MPFIVNGEDNLMRFGGGEFKLSIYSGTTHSQIPLKADDETLVQSFHFRFPATILPVPELAKHKGIRRPRHEPTKNEDDSYNYERPYDYNERGYPISSRDGVIHPSYYWTLSRRGCGVGNEAHGHANWGRWGTSRLDSSFERFSGSQRGRLCEWGRDWRTMFIQHREGNGYNPKRGADVVRTLVPSHGDYRLIAAQKEVPIDAFVPHRFYHESGRYLAHQLSSVHTGLLNRHGNDFTAAPLASGLIADSEEAGRGEASYRYHPARNPDFPQTEFSVEAQKWGDFDNGVAITSDGAYINKPDEGNSRYNLPRRMKKFPIPYFSGAQALGGPSFFSPNRQINSPVMFGSLPTGVKRNRPWETLLFRPQKGHPGTAKPDEGEEKGTTEPPDHAILDWFWMPVVEPWAISEPFSTAGKVNLNYRMQPFSHIKRATGLAAVLKSEQMLVIPNWAALHYKKGALPNQKWIFRHPIDFTETSKQLDERFATGQIFRHASEVCELHLVPKKEKDPVTLEDMEDEFWADHAVVGDNSRERPYANIYPRLTTKSNTYRVHYRVQVLKPGRQGEPGKWEPEYDTVAAEKRGDCLLERYLDPNDERLPDYAGEPDTEGSLLDFYQFRIISNRRFAP